MFDGPTFEVKGLDHPLLNKTITAMMVTEKGIEVTVDNGATFLFIGAVHMIAIGGAVNGRGRLDMLNDVRDVQGQTGNWDYDQYMHGLYNGLEFASSIMEAREPKFKDWPYTYWQFLWKKTKEYFFTKFWYRYIVSPLGKEEDKGTDNRPIKL